MYGDQGISGKVTVALRVDSTAIDVCHWQCENAAANAMHGADHLAGLPRPHEREAALLATQRASIKPHKACGELNKDAHAMRAERVRRVGHGWATRGSLPTEPWNNELRQVYRLETF